MSTNARAPRPPKDHASWKPPEWELPDASALQALERGEANASQQQRALKWIIEQAAATYGMSYRPGESGDRDTAFAEGRRFVGLQCVKLLRLNLGAMRRNDA